MAIRITLQKNPNWRDLPKIHVGDLVLIESVRTFNAFIQLRVTEVSDTRICGIVDAVFDKDMQESDYSKEWKGEEWHASNDCIQRVVWP